MMLRNASATALVALLALGGCITPAAPPADRAFDECSGRGLQGDQLQYCVTTLTAAYIGHYSRQRAATAATGHGFGLWQYPEP